jgi:hypothetical protein
VRVSARLTFQSYALDEVTIRIYGDVAIVRTSERNRGEYCEWAVPPPPSSHQKGWAMAVDCNANDEDCGTIARNHPDAVGGDKPARRSNAWDLDPVVRDWFGVYCRAGSK